MKKERISSAITGFLACALTLILLAGMIACQKTPTQKPGPITPLQTLVNSDTSLSLFHRLLIQANETGLLADDSVTLLLPTNAAFRQAGYSEVTIDSLSNAFADRMVRYQYIPNRITPDSANYTPYPTRLGYNIYGMRDSARHVLFNGVMTTGDATPAGKASVYRLDALIQSAADSLIVILQSDTGFSLLAEVFLRTNLYDSVLLAGNYTLLAPGNNAFRQAGYDSVGSIDSANINVLIQLAENQVLKGHWFTNSFPAVATIPTLAGGSITVNSSAGTWQFTGTGNAIPVNWLSGNMTSGNTLIIHRTDGILSP
jgi:uncharacterized surface protein with fasciclin (FAS1) repeats